MDINNFLNLDKDKKLEQLEEWLKYSNYENIVACFVDHDINITTRISEICINTGKPAINSLIEATNSKNVDIRSWAFATMGQIECINFNVLHVIVKHALLDPNFYVKRKARQALIDVIKIYIKKSLRVLDYLLYFIVISIVQLVTLIFILLPIVIMSSDEYTGSSILYRDLFTIFSMISIIPFLSGFIIVSLTKSNKHGYLFAGLLGFVQSIPYNVFLSIAIQKIGVINVFVQLFGLFGGIIGLYAFYILFKNTTFDSELPIESDIEEQGLTAIRLIRRRIKLSKRFQDLVVGFSSFIGIVLLIYLGFSIYNISYMSTNKKDMNNTKEVNPFPSMESGLYKNMELPKDGNN